MIDLAKGEPRARIEPDALDADLWLLGCPNGTLDLRTGKLREARREDFITKQIAVAFDRAADMPAVARVSRLGDARRQRTGRIPSDLRGLCADGRSPRGKNVRACRRRRERQEHIPHDPVRAMGDYAGKARSDLLVNAQGKEGAPSPDVAALHGKRLVIVSETEDGCSLSEARIKDIVSNEIVAARRLHRDPFTFRPTHKTILATNHSPHVSGNGLRHLATARDCSFQRDGRRSGQGR